MSTARISISDPWISRYYPSAILDQKNGSDLISTSDQEVYGDPKHPIAFRIGNGGAGWTGVIKTLCLQFIKSHGNDFRIGWVVNHSRHSLIAALADVVQVALTYEPKTEELAVREGWCKRVAAPAFVDHFIVVGPKSNPAGIPHGASSTQAVKSIAAHHAVFHTRGDGSATHEKEQQLWSEAGIDFEAAPWVGIHGSTPYQALEIGNRAGAYLLTDRATFLTAKRDGKIPHLAVYVEHESVLLNPCSALVNTKVPTSSGQNLAIAFAEWLKGDEAQAVFQGYGKDWANEMPLFTGAARDDFEPLERLIGKTLSDR